jgi:hypothetical protein
VLRISATTVEQYNYFLSEEYAREQSLIDSIKGIYKPGWQAEHGTALHYILEDGIESHLDPDGKTCSAKGIKFSLSDIETCLKYVDKRGEPEVKVTGLYDVGETVKVVTKADRIVDAVVVEYKSKWGGQFDIEIFSRSFQWRFYLENFGSNEIRYKVFIFNRRASGIIELKSVETFSLYRYPRIRTDCIDMLRKFVGYLDQKNLRSFLDKD